MIDVSQMMEVLNQNIILQYLIIAFFGLFVGSFLNVVNYRVPIMEDLYIASIIKDNAEIAGKNVDELIKRFDGFTYIYPPSACPKCDHKIKFYENIPILSYLFLKGKCSNCKTSISLEYPMVELANCLAWLSALYFIGFNINLVFILPLLTLLISLSIIDFKHLIIFDFKHLMIISLGVLYNIYGDNNLDIKDTILNPIIVFYSIYIFVYSYEKLRKFDGHMLGRGDIKLYAVLSIWIPLSDILLLLMISSIIGIVNFLIVYLINSMSNVKKYQMPFGPSIALGFTGLFTYNLL
jgi:leader peptidase (prepilin peptidase)/N-methyltransferase